MPRPGRPGRAQAQSQRKKPEIRDHRFGQQSSTEGTGYSNSEDGGKSEALAHNNP
jgi:hypothetical protein